MMEYDDHHAILKLVEQSIEGARTYNKYELEIVRRMRYAVFHTADP